MDYHISIEEYSQSNQVFYTYRTDHGDLDASYGPINGWFGIANLDVDREFRRQGIGQILLRKALEDALRLEAKFIYSAILSRECLEAMVRVFGEDAVIIKEKGTFTPENGPDRRDAQAWLAYKPSGNL